MSTIEFPRDPRAIHLLSLPTRTQVPVADSAPDGPERASASLARRERDIKFVQHPSFRAPTPTNLRAA